MKLTYYKRKLRKVFRDLSPETRGAVNNLLSAYGQTIVMPKRDRRLMISDVYRAVLFYLRTGVRPEDFSARLDPARLGDFYKISEGLKRPDRLWYPLDTAAKIYPLSMRRSRMSIFRLSMELQEKIVPELLQMALTFTIRRFPYYAATLKNGFFWHYIEHTPKRYHIDLETPVPCLHMNVSTAEKQCFRVIYYRSRISVEFFHLLTDGTGALAFLKTLVAEYLRLTGVPVPPGGDVFDVTEAPEAREWVDEFRAVEQTRETASLTDKPARQISGRLSARLPHHVVHFEMDADALKNRADGYGVSVTALMLGVLLRAAAASSPRGRGPFNIQVPVNMRKFYASATMRNFSLYCGIRLAPEEIRSLEAMLPKIAAQLRAGTAQTSLVKTLSYSTRLVRALRFIPLVIKKPCAQLVYGFLGERAFATTLSNLGVVTLPEAMAPHVRRMDFVLGTASVNRASCAMVTCGKSAVLSVTLQTAAEAFEDAVAEELYALGLALEITGSE